MIVIGDCPFWETDLFKNRQQYSVVKKVDGYRIFDMWHGHTHTIKVFPSKKAVKTITSQITKNKVKSYYNHDGKKILSDKGTELERTKEVEQYWHSLE